jgi:dihydrofolate reductase
MFIQISLIVAMSNHRVIGKANQMPWHLSSDLQRFKALTLHKPIVMGRKTYESIGKPLPQRENLILTTDPDYKIAGCRVAHSIDEVFEILQDLGAEEVFVIGGAQIYQAFLPLAHRLYLTLVTADLEGDTFFPAYDESLWDEVSHEAHPADAKNEYPYCFKVLARKGFVVP